MKNDKQFPPKWKQLENINELVGETILLREHYDASDNIAYMVGEVYFDGVDTHYIISQHGKTAIHPEEYNYHWVNITGIIF